ncbi:hypothetical protein RA28_02900 [Ruegeria sp. ANG-S4]|nr:hypothetical protein RA28_02900 [Ruegeria sp. ANG-S4]
MRVAFRVDASLVIGTGHVMRCLTLARMLEAHGARCHFICADLPGNLGQFLCQNGVSLTLLPAPRGDAAAPLDYSSWSGLTWADDAEATARELQKQPADWLVVDHYGLDAQWEAAVLRATGAKCLIIDDLANRPHLGRWLLDPGPQRTSADYKQFVPSDCDLLLGPRYALLRPEFSELRDRVLPTRKKRSLRHVLVTMGGVDLPNASSAILSCLDRLTLPEGFHVTLVLGGTAPHLENLRARAEELSFPCDIKVDVRDLHHLMAKADLAIGAAGGTAWERCVLGLPSLMLSTAENQIPAARALEQAGAAVSLGFLADGDGWVDTLAESLQRVRNPRVLAELARNSSSLCDGKGAIRVEKRMRAALETS